MMNLVSVAGKVSHVNLVSTTSGDIRNGRGAINTSHSTSFRVAGRPVVRNGVFDVSDGDFATIVGLDNAGTLSPLAIRNDTTGIQKVDTVSYVAPIVMIVFGVLLAIFLWGFLLIFAGIWIIFKRRARAKLIAKAVDTMRSMPPATASPNA